MSAGESMFAARKMAEANAAKAAKSAISAARRDTARQNKDL